MTRHPGRGVPGDRVTVVVMTRNRWPDLQRTLPRHEAPVVLVDNGSTDGTPELVRRHFPHVQVVEAGRNLGAPARNLGVARATTRYVAFADDDSWWAPGALGRAATLLDEARGVGLLAARVLVGTNLDLDPTSALMAHSPLGRDPGLPGPHVLGFLACGAVVRRSAFLEIGGFDDVVGFLGEEERVALDLAAAGWSVVYAASVVARHAPSSSRPTTEPEERAVRAARNRLLTAVMRRPWPVVVATVRSEVNAGRAGRRGCLAAVPRMARALVHRRVLPPWVEDARRRLDVQPVA